MKLTTAVFALLILPTAAFAATAVEIFDDHEETWSVVSNSITVTKTGRHVLITKHDKAANKTQRFFIGIENTTCTKGYGDAYIRKSSTHNWEELTTVLLSGTTIGDKVANILCAIPQKQLPKNSTSL